MNAEIVFHKNAEKLRAGLAAVADRPLFCTWKLVPVEGGKPRKVPYVASGEVLKGGFDDPGLPARLMRLDKALAAASRRGHCGVGLVFYPGCSVVGLDLDHAVQDGQPALTDVQKQAARLLRGCAFVERSVSGTGLHMIALGDGETVKNNGTVELFADRNFIALTGEDGTGTARAVPASVVSELAQVVRASRVSRGPVRLSASSPASDVNAEALRSQPAQGTEDPARVRSALACIDPASLDYGQWLRITWAAKDALGEDGFELWDNWCLRDLDRYNDEENRKLWDGARERSDGVTAATLFFEARRCGWSDAHDVSEASAASPRSSAAESTEQPVPAVDLASFVVEWGTDPAQQTRPDFLIGRGADGMFPVGKPAVVAGPGGSGKTLVMMSIGLHVAAGKSWDGRQVPPGAVLYLSAEDDGDECRRRLGALTVAQIDPDNHEQVKARFRVVSTPGVDVRFTGHAFGEPVRTGIADALVRAALAHAEQCEQPVRLIVIDHARLVLGGDVNDSEAVTELLRALTFVARQTGAAVVLLAHSPKASLNPDRVSEFNAGDVLGSGAFVDNSRFAAVVFGLTQEERKRAGMDDDETRRWRALRVIKSNYSQTGQTVYMRSESIGGWDVAAPQAKPLPSPVLAVRPTSEDEALAHRIVEFVRQRAGSITRNKLAKDWAGKDGPLGASRPTVERTLTQLLEDGALVQRSPSDQERATHHLGARADVRVLDVPEGCDTDAPASAAST